MSSTELIMLVGEEVLPAEGCALHTEHSPRLLGCVRWYCYPFVLQDKVKHARQGYVTDSVPMCPTGRLNVSMALHDLLSHDGCFVGHYSAIEKHYAWKAYDAYRSALHEQDQRREDGTDGDE